jgi:3-oxoacyl-[acyl-carrier-protein] synthase III
MGKSKFTKAKISGVVSYFPSTIRYFDEDAKSSNFDPRQIDKIKKNIGLNERYVTASKTTTLDLCYAASVDFLKGLKINKDDIDRLILLQ